MVQVNQRQSRMLELKPYCHHSKPHDFMEVTEWVNGEGFDVYLNAARGAERVSLTHGEWEALQVLVAYRSDK
jgi:hypothetical protein